MEFHEKIRTGEKMVKLSGDSIRTSSERVIFSFDLFFDLAMRQLMSRIIPSFLSGFVLSVGSFIVAYLINWQLSLILTSFVSIYGFSAFVFGKFGNKIK